MAEENSIAIPPFARLGERRFPVEVLVVTERQGGWHVTGVYVRQREGSVTMHPRWPKRWSETADLETEWRYLADRALDGSGGNYYTWELEGYEVGHVTDIEKIVNARAAEVVVAAHGPLGETAGTIGNPWAIDVAVMPFVVLMDDRDRPMLVATSANVGAVTVTTGDQPTLPRQAFASRIHWQQDGQPCWPLAPDTLHRVRWERGEVDLVVDTDADIISLTTPCQ